MDAIKFSFADTKDESKIRQLLADNDLVHEDLSAGLLKHFRLGWDGSRLVAVVGLEIIGRSALLRSLAVDANYRSRRIATRMVAEMEDYARTLNVDALYLLTMTAEAFFKKCGYRPGDRDSAPAEIRQTTEFQSLCPASAACMVKYIDKE